ncbi:hypothetical protein EK904_002405, partial [Melospiza melodia maxima]
MSSAFNVLPFNPFENAQKAKKRKNIKYTSEPWQHCVTQWSKYGFICLFHEAQMAVGSKYQFNCTGSNSEQPSELGHWAQFCNHFQHPSVYSQALLSIILLLSSLLFHVFNSCRETTLSPLYPLVVHVTEIPAHQNSQLL